MLSLIMFYRRLGGCLVLYGGVIFLLFTSCGRQEVKSLSASSEQVNFALSWLSFLDKEEFDEAWKRSDKVLQLEFSNSAEWGEFINRARGFCCAEKNTQNIASWLL